MGVCVDEGDITLILTMSPSSQGRNLHDGGDTPGKSTKGISGTRRNNALQPIPRPFFRFTFLVLAEVDESGGQRPNIFMSQANGGAVEKRCPECEFMRICSPKIGIVRKSSHPAPETHEERLQL
jgi:hypothetical protein